MTHYDLLLAVQLMSEERYGKPRRELEQKRVHEEDLAQRKLIRAVQG